MTVPFEFPHFREPALCAEADPDEWFPEKGGSTVRAKEICNGVPGRYDPCPARQECLEWALTHREEGVWGGLSGRERATLRRLRAAGVNDAAARILARNRRAS